jgi:ribonuclease-3
MTESKSLLHILPPFSKPTLLTKALTHPSYRRYRINDFERLEFLGDRVLGLIVAEMLYQIFPHEKEGDLAKRSASLVNRDVCYEIAQEIQLGDHVKVVGADLNQNTSVLSDTLEAVIGAIYLDGGIEAARQFVEPLWKTHIHSSNKPPKDYKSQLQEWSQRHALGIPQYAVTSTTGPAHNPEFIVEVSVGEHKAQATGSPRKQAEQEAARLLMERVTTHPS